MTQSEMLQIAQMTASIMQGNGPVTVQEAAPEASAPKVASDTIPVITTRLAPSNGHLPSFSPEQLVAALNDVRLETRIVTKYPLIEALEQAFAQSKIKADINGKRQPLISLETMGMIIDHLKSKGQYWPKPVLSCLNEEGKRVYVNSNHKSEEGAKWYVGGEVKFKSAPKTDEVVISVQA